MIKKIIKRFFNNNNIDKIQKRFLKKQTNDKRENINFENFKDLDYFEQKMKNKMNFLNLDKSDKILINNEYDINLINGIYKEDGNLKKFLFYNFNMEYERNISLEIFKYLSIKTNKKLNFGEMFAETGIRTLRLLKNYKEYINSIDIYNNHENFDKLFNLNMNNNKLEFNNLNIHKKYFEIKENHYDLLEIDPKVNSFDYIDKGIKSLKNDGIIGITFSNLRNILSKENPKWFENEFERKKIYVNCKKEFGLRSILSKLNKIANDNGKETNLQLNYFHSFFLKLYIKFENKKNFINLNFKHYHVCKICPNFEYSSNIILNCNVCNSDNLISKNLYDSYLINKNFLIDFEKIINQKTNISSLNSFHEYIKELLKIKDDNRLINIQMNQFNKFFKIKPLKILIIMKALSSKNYIVYHSNFEELSILTNAPTSIIIDLLKLIVK